jgi:hypothetical protein
MMQNVNTKMQTVNKRKRISLNGLWPFILDENGVEQLGQVQEAFKTAQLVAERMRLEIGESERFKDAADLAGAKEEGSEVLDSYSKYNGGNGNGHAHASQNEMDAEAIDAKLLDPELGERGARVRIVSVPAPWQSQSPDLCYAEGVGWYQRNISIPREWLEDVPEDKRIFLGIDASDYHTKVWFNGVLVGENEGGYLPFEFDVSQAIKAGDNLVTIRVDDSAELFSDTPHGKQGWYGQLSGIWQPVWLEKRTVPTLAQVQVFPDLDTGKVKAEIHLYQPALPGLSLKADILEPAGDIASSTLINLEAGVKEVELDLHVKDQEAWSPAAPNLYQLEVDLLDKRGIGDKITKSFGFRKIEARDGRLYLNGELLYLRGALDQDYYLDTIYTTPDEQFLEDQFLKAKELGLNLLRLHIKVPDPVYYDIADRVGMLIWTELPNWSVFSRTACQRGRETLEGIIKRDGHHPSIIVWTIINEGWGTDLVEDPGHRQWLKETYHWLKALDPSRLVVDNSPCYPNFHMQSDIDDYHFYRGLPDQRREWDEFINQFAARPDFTYGPAAEITRTGKEPIILSEFGNWGLPDADLLVDSNGADPWWFDSGREWTEGVVHPLGVRERFRRLGLGGVFGSWKSFINATQEQQFYALKYELESIRQKPEISGYIITELTDVHWECNGLLDMRRNPKSFQSKFTQINADTVILPRWERVAYWSGEGVQLRLSVAHGASKPLEGGEVHWRIKGHLWGNTKLPTLAAGQVWEMGLLIFQAPSVEKPEIQQVNFELVDRDGALLSSNYLDLVFHPRIDLSNGDSMTVDIPIYTTEEGLGGKLVGLGYTVVPSLEDARLVITGILSGQPYTSDVLSFLEEGGRGLVLADRAGEDGPVFPGILVTTRDHTPWAGDWASSFSWVKRSGPFSNLPGGPMVDQSFDAVIPKSVLIGFKEWEFPRMVQAGLVVGWVHKPAVLIGERRYGKGKVILNSFHLPDEILANDPTATVLMQALIAKAGS